MNIQDVENLAELARIELREEEEKGLLKDMEHILEYVRQIEEARLNDKVGQVKIEDMELDQTLHNIWREDELVPREFSRELLLSQFPDSENGFVKVKKIL